MSRNKTADLFVFWKPRMGRGGGRTKQGVLCKCIAAAILASKNVISGKYWKNNNIYFIFEVSRHIYKKTLQMRSQSGRAEIRATLGVLG